MCMCLFGWQQSWGQNYPACIWGAARQNDTLMCSRASSMWAPVRRHSCIHIRCEKGHEESSDVQVWPPGERCKWRLCADMCVRSWLLSSTQCGLHGAQSLTTCTVTDVVEYPHQLQFSASACCAVCCGACGTIIHCALATHPCHPRYSLHSRCITEVCACQDCTFCQDTSPCIGMSVCHC